MATDSALTFYSYFCFGHGFPSQNVPDGQLSFTVLVYRVLHSSRPRCFVNSAGVQRARFFGKWDSMEITKGNQRGSEIPCHPIFGDRFSPFSFLLRASLGRPRPCCGFFVVFSSLLIRPITRLMHLVLTFHDDCHVLSRVLVILLVCRLLSWFFLLKILFFCRFDQRKKWFVIGTFLILTLDRSRSRIATLDALSNLLICPIGSFIPGCNLLSSQVAKKKTNAIHFSFWLHRGGQLDD